MKQKLTLEQVRRIYCVKHGHAKFITKCFGYVYCGRCGDQLGDTLASTYPCDSVMVVGCKDKSCKVCGPIREKLNKMDKKILQERIKEMKN